MKECLFKIICGYLFRLISLNSLLLYKLCCVLVKYLLVHKKYFPWNANLTTNYSEEPKELCLSRGTVVSAVEQVEFGGLSVVALLQLGQLRGILVDCGITESLFHFVDFLLNPDYKLFELLN